MTVGFTGRHAAADLVGSGSLDEIPQLVSELAFKVVPAKDPPQQSPEAVQQYHAPSSTLVMAAVTRAQRCSSRSSCLRPFAVR